jgi:hypothetical protein
MVLVAFNHTAPQQDMNQGDGPSAPFSRHGQGGPFHACLVFHQTLSAGPLEFFVTVITLIKGVQVFPTNNWDIQTIQTFHTNVKIGTSFRMFQCTLVVIKSFITAYTAHGV